MSMCYIYRCVCWRPLCRL